MVNNAESRKRTDKATKKPLKNYFIREFSHSVVKPITLHGFVFPVVVLLYVKCVFYVAHAQRNII